MEPDFSAALSDPVLGLSVQLISHLLGMVLPWFLVIWLIWQNRRRDRDVADLLSVATLTRTARHGSLPEERLYALRSLGERLGDVRPPENEGEAAPEVAPPPDGIEITAAL